MIEKIKKILNFVSNMGLRYVVFRISHELLKKTGLLKRRFKVNPPFKQFLTFEDWKNQKTLFFFESKDLIYLPLSPNKELERTFKNITSGKFLLFNSIEFDLGINYDWVTNPDTGYKYNISKHWSEIEDFSELAGDIKYVWEKSRFSYLYDIIRYDYHFEIDCSEFVFNEILSWIKANPINCGPNYRCSQEISLRILNWTYALHYYKNSKFLTDEVFNQIQFAIYWQVDHVYKNINFSRIAVRNNHAITETLTLYLVGIFYPKLPNIVKIKEQGKKWFEDEIAYQIYEDGTFLQFSMNYHRVVVQLLTWAIALSERNNERFSKVVYERAQKSVAFLSMNLCSTTGWLPNYGNNDGALFFKLSNSHYRDFRPQLQALANALDINISFIDTYEDSSWYGYRNQIRTNWEPSSEIHVFFEMGGYYIAREKDTLTFIRCGNHKDRPHQADNLHIDIWYKGENILIDGGTYKYNTDEETIKYFAGSASHNTVMLDDNDQMLKGKRFIWYYWTQCKQKLLQADAEKFMFVGEIDAFKHIGKNITHTRHVIKVKNRPLWVIRDTIKNAPDNMQMKQLWHIPKQFEGRVKITSTDSKDEKLNPTLEEGWFSGLYGQREKTLQYCLNTQERMIETFIEIMD